ncbi:MAG: alpha/beta hydrolase [Actinomycetota bacterium]
MEPIDLAARLDDTHRAVLEMIPPDLLDLSDIDRARVGIEGLLAALPSPEPPAGLATEDVMVPGLDGDPEVLVRLYRPAGLAADAPAIYWIHGGGMVLGSMTMDDARCSRWADQLGCVVASVEYRLAPEHPFPAPMNDCYAGLSWLAANASELGIDPARIAIGGASAGGGLAAGLAIMAKDSGGPSVCFQLLVFPMLDHTNTEPSTHAIVDPRTWNREANAAGWAAYLGDADRSSVSPLASPAMAEVDGLVGLPPAYINVGEFDLFLDEDMSYARALMTAGVPVDLHVYPGAFHGSQSFAVDHPTSIRWNADEDAALARAFAG